MPRVTLIPGDGIGPEISAITQRVLSVAHADIQWDVQTIENGQLNPAVTQSLESTRLGLKGPIMTPIGKGFRSINVHLRKTYDLYACVRPVSKIGNVPSRYDDVDLVIFRENTEDLYAGLEEQISDTEAHSIKVITEAKSRRIALAAYTYARQHGRKKVAIVQKANIMKLSDGLFLRTCLDVAKDFPDIETQEVLVDNMCMQLVVDPSRYDVILTENLYGDILSDLCAGLVGGLGFVPGANLGTDMAIFEATHGTAPDIAGQGIANPTAMILSACMLLDHIGQTRPAQLIRQALYTLYRNSAHFTKDIKGPLDSASFERVLTDEIRRLQGASL